MSKTIWNNRYIISKSINMGQLIFKVIKTFHFTTEDSTIVEIPIGNILHSAGRRYATAVIDKAGNPVFCYLSPEVVQKNSEYIAECSGDEADMYSLLDDVEEFFTKRNLDESLVKLAYERVLEILKMKDERDSLKEENKKLQSEIFVLKINQATNPSKDSTNPYQNPLNPSPWTQPWTPQPILSSSNCRVCGVDLATNTHYVCMSSICPSRISWTTSAVGTTTFDLPGSSTLNIQSSGSSDDQKIQ